MDDLTARIHAASEDIAAAAQHGLGPAMRRAEPDSPPPPPRMKHGGINPPKAAMDDMAAKLAPPPPDPIADPEPRLRLYVPASDNAEAISHHRERLADLEKEAIRFGAEIERDIRAKQAVVDELDRAYRERRARYDREIESARRHLDRRLSEISKLAEASRAALAVLESDEGEA